MAKNLCYDCVFLHNNDRSKYAMTKENTTYVSFNNKMVFIGFGSVGQAVLPLILRHIKIDPAQITIITKKDDGAKIAKEFGVKFVQESVLPDNYKRILSENVQ